MAHTRRQKTQDIIIKQEKKNEFSQKDFITEIQLLVKEHLFKIADIYKHVNVHIGKNNERIIFADKLIANFYNITQINNIKEYENNCIALVENILNKIYRQNYSEDQFHYLNPLYIVLNYIIGTCKLLQNEMIAAEIYFDEGFYSIHEDNISETVLIPNILLSAAFTCINSTQHHEIEKEKQKFLKTKAYLLKLNSYFGLDRVDIKKQNTKTKQQETSSLKHKVNYKDIQKFVEYFNEKVDLKLKLEGEAVSDKEKISFLHNLFGLGEINQSLEKTLTIDEMNDKTLEIMGLSILVGRWHKQKDETDEELSLLMALQNSMMQHEYLDYHLNSLSRPESIIFFTRAILIQIKQCISLQGNPLLDERKKAGNYLIKSTNYIQFVNIITNIIQVINSETVNDKYNYSVEFEKILEQLKHDHEQYYSLLGTTELKAVISFIASNKTLIRTIKPEECINQLKSIASPMLLGLCNFILGRDQITCINLVQQFINDDNYREMYITASKLISRLIADRLIAEDDTLSGISKEYGPILEVLFYIANVSKALSDIMENNIRSGKTKIILSQIYLSDGRYQTSNPAMKVLFEITCACIHMYNSNFSAAQFILNQIPDDIELTRILNSQKMPDKNNIKQFVNLKNNLEKFPNFIIQIPNKKSIIDQFVNLKNTLLKCPELINLIEKKENNEIIILLNEFEIAIQKKDYNELFHLRNQYEKYDQNTLNENHEVNYHCWVALNYFDLFHQSILDKKDTYEIYEKASIYHLIEALHGTPRESIRLHLQLKDAIYKIYHPWGKDREYIQFYNEDFSKLIVNNNDIKELFGSSIFPLLINQYDYDQKNKSNQSKRKNNPKQSKKSASKISLSKEETTEEIEAKKAIIEAKRLENAEKQRQAAAEKKRLAAEQKALEKIRLEEERKAQEEKERLEREAQKIRDEKKQKNRLKNQRKKEIKRVIKLQEEKHHLEQEIVAAQDKRGQLEEKVISITEELSLLEKQITEVVEEIHQAQSEELILETELVAIQEEKLRIEANLEVVEQRLHFEEEKSKTEADISSTQEEIVKIRAEIDCLVEKELKVQEEILRQESELKVIEEGILEAKRKIDEVEEYFCQFRFKNSYKLFQLNNLAKLFGSELKIIGTFVFKLRAKELGDFELAQKINPKDVDVYFDLNHLVLPPAELTQRVDKLVDELASLRFKCLKRTDKYCNFEQIDGDIDLSIRIPSACIRYADNKTEVNSEKNTTKDFIPMTMGVAKLKFRDGFLQFMVDHEDPNFERFDSTFRNKEMELGFPEEGMTSYAYRLYKGLRYKETIQVKNLPAIEIALSEYYIKLLSNPEQTMSVYLELRDFKKHGELCEEGATKFIKIILAAILEHKEIKVSNEEFENLVSILQSCNDHLIHQPQCEYAFRQQIDSIIKLYIAKHDLKFIINEIQQAFHHQQPIINVQSDAMLRNSQPYKYENQNPSPRPAKNSPRYSPFIWGSQREKGRLTEDINTPKPRFTNKKTWI